ncbi:MAG TPA: hypothetical protein VJ464_10040 [Blastocatellia bacterium]|nr:hypothetical protein [Blastocatellia bacterium]
MKRFLLYLLLIIFIFAGFQVMWPGRFICQEETVIADIQTITKAEVIYSLTKGRGQFADLAALAEAKMIDPTLASGEKNGYLFVVKVEAMTGRKAMYEVTAKPKNWNEMWSGSHSFYSNETIGPEVYETEGTEPPRGTVEDRVPKAGLPIGVAR